MQAIGRTAKDAARKLASISTDVKNKALLAMAGALDEHQGEILRANQHDMQASQEAGVTGYILDRLLLTPERLDQYANDMRSSRRRLPDPVGEGLVSRRTMANGLTISKVRVPLGVLACIYEARPERHRGHRVALPEGRQRDDPARWQRSVPLQQHDRAPDLARRHRGRRP